MAVENGYFRDSDVVAIRLLDASVAPFFNLGRNLQQT